MTEPTTATALSALAGLSPTQVVMAVAGASRFAWGKWQEYRLEQLRPILMEELRQGRASLLEAYEVDRFLSCLHRWERLAVEGAAKNKLRLMAKILAGQIESRSLVPDEFIVFAAMIESLRREEIIFAATRNRLEVKYQHLGNEQQLEDELGQLLIPRIFASKAEMTATAAALQRTGLIVGASAWGGNVYHCGPLMAEFVRLARLEGSDWQDFEN